MSDILTDKLRTAHGHFQARNLAGAEQLCGEILRAAPGNPEALHLLGVVRLVTGNADEAATLIAGALESDPQNAPMLEHLGLARLALRDYTAAEAAFRQSFALGADHGLLHMRLGMALAAQGKLTDAVAALRIAATSAPGDPDVHLNLGNTLAEQGQWVEALACYNKVLALQPDHAGARYNLGNLYRNMGRLEEAASALREVLAVTPDDADAHNNLGLVYERQQRLDDAVSSYQQALALSPGHIHACNNLGNVLRAQGRLDDAVACYQRTLTAMPGNVDALINLGITRAEQGRYTEAQDLHETVLRRDPRNFEAHYNLGSLFKLQGRVADSISSHRKALEADAKRVIVHNALGGAYRQIGDLEAAIASFRNALALDGENIHVHCELAETFKVQGNLGAAMDSYERALALKPDDIRALGGLVHLRQHACKWQGIEPMWQRVREAIASGIDGGISPFSVLSMPSLPAEQLACARLWTKRELAPLNGLRSNLGFEFSKPRPRDRLRVGYLSWGFHRHATAHLAAELFELHDRGRFEVFAYAYGPDDGSGLRARMRHACEHFVDVSQESYLATAKRIYQDGVDLLVDLTGYTFGARPQILALRPAPIQVNWLGYPGTMGTDCVGYLIADPFVVPAAEEAAYEERIVRLPDCYQINDRHREISERVPTREEFGLPGDGFVFCCFNQAYKILPDVFALWMRILKAVPDSVLWLGAANSWQPDNLRREAAARGVAAKRLVFAQRRPLPDYLAQYRLADLALDTFPYTSHTTASDALWMGCPLVARTGDTFASRVSGSILLNAGLPELVCDNADDYERLVVELATNRAKLQDIRRRLQSGRDSCPLFDTPQLVRNLESSYASMFRAWLEGSG